MGSWQVPLLLPKDTLWGGHVWGRGSPLGWEARQRLRYSFPQYFQRSWLEVRCFIFFISFNSNNLVRQPCFIDYSHFIVNETEALEPRQYGSRICAKLCIFYTRACQSYSIKANSKYFRFDGLIRSLLHILILYYKPLKIILSSQGRIQQARGLYSVSPWYIYNTYCGLCYAFLGPTSPHSCVTMVCLSPATSHGC